MLASVGTSCDAFREAMGSQAMRSDLRRIFPGAGASSPPYILYPHRGKLNWLSNLNRGQDTRANRTRH